MFLEMKGGELRGRDVSKVFLPLWTIMWQGKEERGADRKGIHFIMNPTVFTALNIPTQIKPIFGVNVY